MTLDPKQKFWLAVPIDRADGRLSEIDSDGKISSANRKVVTMAAVADCDEYGGRFVLYECFPRQIIRRARAAKRNES